MPALTRSAAHQIVVDKEGEIVDVCPRPLVLRESVTAKASQVWAHRGEVDVYCGATRTATERPQVDHCLEVQLAETALVRAFNNERGCSVSSIATAQASDLIRAALNKVSNLNVTSAKINQAKRGPFTAALNRLDSDRLRSVSIEQLARQGRGKWMVDNGTWARIEKAVVASYDDVAEALEDADALPAASKLVKGSVEELQSMLCALGLR